MNQIEFAENILYYQEDWCRFARDILRIKLDPQQEAILRGVQHNKMVTVRSGTARGKDFVAAAAALCFLYLTPDFDDEGEMIASTKIALTAPTGRQIKNIMMPEITKMYNRAKFLPGNLMSDGIRFDYFKDWFLVGFKASDSPEAWSGFHAVNTMFVITEASGIPEVIYEAIEGNLQQNSRMLLVFNPNTTTGYAASSHKSARFTKFRLSSLDAPNVLARKTIFPGQVDYEWICDKVNQWCTTIQERDFNEGEGDFRFQVPEKPELLYRPNDLFRIKVLGMFPKVSEDALIPINWVELANQRWIEKTEYLDRENLGPKSLGVDVAGMGRDSSVLCHRHGSYVWKFDVHFAAGKADHMAISGMVANALKVDPENKAFIDTIGEGAGVYSRLIELGYDNAFSCKFSSGAKGLNDITGVYKFANLRAYLFWCVRDWLNPANNNDACLPLDDQLIEEATAIKWKFQSDGSIIIEPKEDIKTRLGRSIDKFDALANTFYPAGKKTVDLSKIFF
ncbi:MAG: hypothetical protein K0B15_07345 [Lentimicrobium sp.]|nr:hypothetical protein [Lentimicrobium sp.]